MKIKDLEKEITLSQLTQFYILTSSFAMFISNEWLQDKVSSYYVWKAKWRLWFYKERVEYFREIEKKRELSDKKW